MPILENTLLRFLSAELCDVTPVDLPGGVRVYVRPLSYELLADIRSGRYKEDEAIPVGVAHALCDELGRPLFPEPTDEQLKAVIAKPLPALTRIFEAAIKASVPDLDAAKKN